MPMRKLKELLDNRNAHYVAVTHTPAYTAQEIAARAHIPGQELAKTVIIKIDGKMAMAVLPANFKVDFDQLKRALGTDDVEMAREEEFKYLFPECEIGAMPPFGNLFGMDTYVAECLARDEHISFNAGTHRELIRLPYKEYEELVQPKIINFTIQMH